MRTSVEATSVASAGDSSEPEQLSTARTRMLVETAMLSAVTGMLYLFSRLFKLEAYTQHLLPFPLVLACCRSSILEGWKTLLATSILLSVLMGPVSSLSYVLLHGLPGLLAGTAWAAGYGWSCSLPAGIVVRILGQLVYLLMSCFTLQENLFQLLINGVYSMLDLVLPAPVSPTPTTLATIILLLLATNNFIYMLVQHLIHSVLLMSMKEKTPPLPGFARRLLFANNAQP